MPISSRRLSSLVVIALVVVSVFSARPALANDFVVTSFEDSGPGTLRQAILDANASFGPDTITFSTGGTINLLSPLPEIIGGDLTIDGTVPSGGTIPQVELRGNGTVEGQGLLIKSSNNTIRGFIINGFNASLTRDKGGAGIVISAVAVAAASNNTVEYSYIGTNVAGTDIGFENKPINNFYGGVLLLGGASDNIVQNNVISGNFGPGVSIERGDFGTSEKIQSGNIIRNNLIGLDATGANALANDFSGVSISDNSNANIIGPGNVISGNGRDSFVPPYGVLIDGSLSDGGYIRDNKVQGNLIGTDQNGRMSIPNRGGGVQVSSSENTLIGGPNEADRNIIAGNPTAGVTVERALDTPSDEVGTVGITIQNNWIGLGANREPLGNTDVGVLIHRGARGVTVGPDNLISYNQRDGVHIKGIEEATPEEQTRDNVISSNRVTNNNADGILISDGAINNRITGTTTNTNGGDGIAFESGGNLDGTVRPLLNNLTLTDTTVSGTLLNTESCTPDCTIEVFSGFGSDPGEGLIYHTGTTATDTFSVDVPLCRPFLLFTVTDGSGNTSSFGSQIGPFAQCDAWVVGRAFLPLTIH